MKMNCIIVDDEPLAREAIEILVAKSDGLNLMGSFNGADAAGKFLSGNTTDIIFLDIQMPGVNGIDFARNIPKETMVIFTTAFSEFATDSYEVDAIDYLIKPVKEQNASAKQLRKPQPTASCSRTTIGKTISEM